MVVVVVVVEEEEERQAEAGGQQGRLRPEWKRAIRVVQCVDRKSLLEENRAGGEG